MNVPHLIGADASLVSQLSGVAPLREDYIAARTATHLAVRLHREGAASVTNRLSTLHSSACSHFNAMLASTDGDFATRSMQTAWSRGFSTFLASWCLETSSSKTQEPS
jgi:hypothetical protein